MSAIDELKNSPISIDMDEPEELEDGLIIDSSSGEERVTKVDLSGLNKRSNHRIVTHIPKENNLAARVSANITDIATDEPEDTHVSPMDDMIGTDNPNSLLSQYIARKDEEAREWITEREEEKAVLADEDEEDSDTVTIGAEEGYEDSSRDINTVMSDDIDLSGLFNEDEREEENMSDIKDILEEDEVVEIDELIDTEDLPDDEEVSTAEASDDEEESEEDEKVEIGKIEEVDIEEEVSYTAPEIEVEQQEDVFSSVEIEEDDDNATTEVAEPDNDETLKHLQKLATEKLKPVSKNLDISSFTVLKKPTNNINPIFQATSARVVKWVLPTQESVVLMKEFSGAELEKLREYTENSRSVDSLNRRFHMIYDHIVSPKPATFEQWLKSTPYDDVDHYFFAVYIASFNGSNYLPQDCANEACKETFLTDNINIMDMVKFDSAEAKEKFVSLYRSEATPAGKGIYCTEIVPITNKIAVSFRQPSIYNLIEIASLDQKTLTTYSHIIDYIPYIDTIYEINAEEGTLTPISYKVFADNAQRTVRSKIKKYNSIFDLMSVDEFGPVKAYVRAITEKTSDMRYVYPEVECPKCHTHTTEQRATAEELVFTRYQLGSLVTTSLK